MSRRVGGVCLVDWSAEQYIPRQGIVCSTDVCSTDFNQPTKVGTTNLKILA